MVSFLFVTLVRGINKLIERAGTTGPISIIVLMFRISVVAQSAEKREEAQLIYIGYLRHGLANLATDVVTKSVIFPIFRNSEVSKSSERIEEARIICTVHA